MAHPARQSSSTAQQPGGPLGQAVSLRVFCGGEAAADTLCQFAEDWFIPRHLLARNPPVRPRTIAELDTALSHWRAITGDPPLVEISHATCLHFLEQFRQRRGRSGETVSDDTIYKVCSAIQDVLNHAGPAGHHCKKPAEEMGLFGSDASGRPRPAPWFPDLQRGKHLPRVCLSLEQIRALVSACGHATQPAIDECTAPAWWSALYRFEFWTGLRIGSGLYARRQWIKRDGELVWIEIPAEYYKGGRPEVLWLHPRAVAAIESLGTTDRIFPWPHTFKHLETVHKRLLQAAGMLTLRDYALHTFRRAIGSALYEVNPEAARLLLCHQGGVTVRNYVQVKSRVRGQAKILKPLLDCIARRNPGL